MKHALACTLVAFAPAIVPVASAQNVEPGEWQFDSTTSMSGLPQPQTASIKRCVKQEEAANPEAWITRQSSKNDCTFTPKERTSTTLKWEMHCPKTNMRGTGTATFSGKTLESEMKMSTELQGRKLDLTTHLTGRRLGPCPT